MENRGLTIVKIVLLSVIAVILLCILLVLLYKPNTKFEFFNVSTKSKLVYDNEFVDDITSLNIDSLSSDIRIEETNNDKIKVQIYGKNDENIKVEVNGDRLSIAEEANSFCFGFCYFPDYRIVVSVPVEKEYNVNLGTASGDIYVGNILTSDLNIKSVSGDIDVKNKNNKLSIDSVSGDLKIGEVGTISAKTISGEIDIYKISEKCDIKTTSGDIEINIFNPINPSKITTVSGDVEIHDNTSYINTSTVSGDVDILNNDRYAEVETNIKTTSGDIEVGD